MKLLLCGFKYNEIYVLTIAAATATAPAVHKFVHSLFFLRAAEVASDLAACVENVTIASTSTYNFHTIHFNELICDASANGAVGRHKYSNNWAPPIQPDTFCVQLTADFSNI